MAVTVEEISTPLEYLAIALASNNMTSELFQVFICKREEYSYKAFYECLCKDFAGIGEENLKIICTGIFGAEVKMSSNGIWKFLIGIMDPVRIFTSNEEDAFGNTLKVFMNNKGQAFLTSCEEIDKGYRGNVSFHEFLTVLKNLDFNSSKEIVLYLRYICYRNSSNINAVSYSILYMNFKSYKELGYSEGS